MAGPTHKRNYYIQRKEALTMEQVIDEFLRGAKISQGLNEQRVFAAWDECTGASQFTIDKSFRSGMLIVSLSSSMVRSHLWLQKDSIVARINEWLQKDSLFVKEEGSEHFVKELFLK